MGQVIQFRSRSKDARQVLADARRRGGWSQTEFARLIGQAIGRPGLSAGAIRAWEAGAIRVPRQVLEAAVELATRHAGRQEINPVAASHARAPAELPSLSTLHENLRTLAARYDRAPSTSLLAEAGQYLGQVALLRQQVPARAQSALDAREAEAATLMGQLIWDASQRRDHATARAHFDRAIAAARRLGDRTAEGHALLRKSFVALYGERDPLAGLALAEETAATTGRTSRVLAGLGLLHAAEAHAMLASEGDCERALGAAETQLGRVARTDPAAEMYSEAQFDRLAGSCYLYLGRYGRAASILSRTADGLQDRQKSRAIVLANLALAHLRRGELDATTGHLHRAIDLVEQTRGGGALNLVFGVGRELAPWRQEPAVQHVHDRLHALMAAR